ncbi:HD superfamily phosphohydrolase YqeK [Catenulispora sp. MAP5-51]|uniref:HD domain-containing phosphohydrolase n=1 Tax=Catenulispora sp. MAP5-51 TaxID=3156298 RepID=UPI003512E072
MPFSVRCYIFGLVAAAVTVDATLPLSRTGLPLLLALCALVVAAERLSRVQIGTSGWTMSVSLVVTLITVLVLPPPGAALVGLASSVPMPRQPSWTWTKQTINSAMSSLIPASGSAVCYLAGGHDSSHFLYFPEFLWPAAAAFTTCLVVNALVIASYVGLATHHRFVDALRGDIRRATMPYYSSGVLALIFLSLWDDIGWYTAPLVVVPMYIAHWSLSQYAKENAAHEGTIAALVQAVEIKDSYTRGHSERVARGAEMLAEQLKMPQDRLAMLRFAGLLHDIGKLGVPTRLLTSTGGLTEEEFKLLCMHPNHGVAVLRDIRFLTEVYEGVLYHHERLDGRGYPTGKSGEQIPEFARIIGVADAFDAMTSTRSYRAARSVEEAVAELRRGAGTQFDPVLVRAFEDALEFAERAGKPWVPTELVPAEPAQDDGTSTAASSPWPLPKRVPGFSFADHDDPFVPVEWFSTWYPSWLTPEGEPGPDGEGQVGGIPGQRAGEPEPAVAEIEAVVEAVVEAEVGAVVEAVAEADLDDGWSERMHSAVVREPEPELDEGWAWDAERGAVEAEGGEAEPEPGSEPESDLEASVEDHSVTLEQPTKSEPAPEHPAGNATAAPSTRWPVDPGLNGEPRGSMRVRTPTPAADGDPRGTGTVSAVDGSAAPDADFDLRKPAALCQGVAGPAVEPGDAAEDTVAMPKAGDPEAWTPSPEPWVASESSAEVPGAPKAGDPADADGRSGPSLGSAWFARGAGGSSPTLHFFGPGDSSPWPPRDPDAKDSEESPA